MAATSDTSLIDTSAAPCGHVLVLVHEFQRNHPTLRALRAQAEHTTISIVEVDFSDLDQGRPQPLLDQCRAVAAIGADSARAARLAIDHGLVHLELGVAPDNERLDETLTHSPDPQPVVAVAIDGSEVTYGLRNVHLEFADTFDIEVIGHRWTDITGPVTIDLSERRNGDIWLTVRDGPAALLAASPPLSATLDITARSSGTIISDGRRSSVDAPGHVHVAFPSRHLTIRIEP